jgi:hypothetical protein
MSETNSANLEERFENGKDVLDYFDLQTLQAKIRRRTPLSADETRRIIHALKRHHLRTVP